MVGQSPVSDAAIEGAVAEDVVVSGDVHDAVLRGSRQSVSRHALRFNPPSVGQRQPASGAVSAGGIERPRDDLL